MLTFWSDQSHWVFFVPKPNGISVMKGSGCSAELEISGRASSEGKFSLRTCLILDGRARVVLLSLLSRITHICIPVAHCNFLVSNCLFTLLFEQTIWQWTNMSISNDKHEWQASLILSSWQQTTFCLWTKCQVPGKPCLRGPLQKCQKMVKTCQREELTCIVLTKLSLSYNTIQMILVVVVHTKCPLD